MLCEDKEYYSENSFVIANQGGGDALHDRKTQLKFI